MAVESNSKRLQEILLLPQQRDDEVTIFDRERSKSSIAPIPRENFYVHGNGIDIKAGKFSNGEATQYEKECFKKIASLNHKKDTIILGPHFIDDVFPVAFRGKVRPDAVQFNVSNKDVWVLSDLYEFKSGNVNGPVRKLTGFSNLLNHMRDNENAFPSLLKEAMPWAEDALPNRIIIPPERNISVVFISPDFKHNVIYDETVPPFQLAHVHFAPTPAGQ